MLFLRAPSSDKRCRRVSPPQTPGCWVKRSSHRLTFPPGLEGKRSPRCRRLCTGAGSARQHPRVPLPPGAPGRGAPAAGRAAALRYSVATAALGMNIYIPCKSAARRRRRGASVRLVAGARNLPRMRMSPSRQLLAQVCPAFVSLDYQLGLGRGAKASQ